VFDGNGTYAGNTTISAGLVRLVSGVTPLGTGTVTVASGATLDFNFLTLDNPLNVLSGGILLNTGTSQTTDVSDNVVFSGTTDGVVDVKPGGNADFQGAVNATVTVGSGAGAVFEASAGGAPTVTVLSGGAVTVAGTAAGSLGVLNGGVVAFSGSNAPSSSFNVAAGGLVTTSSASTIGGQLSVSGSAVIGGAVAADAGVIVQNGGTVKLVNGAAFAQTILLNDGALVLDRSEALALATAISGTGRLEKTGSGILELTGANTFTGPTALNAGTLLLNGSLASDVAALADATLGGSGSIAGTISGAGLVSPGNSPGILEAGQFDPTGGLDAAFEFTAFAPNYAVSGTGALNDVLRLTDSSPFVANLGTGNVVDVYFNVASLEYNDEFQGGFFTTQSPEALLAAVQRAEYQFWFRTSGAGQRIFEGVNYDPLSSEYSDFSGARVETRSVTANFGGGEVTGSVMSFVIVPEPGAMIPAGIGILALVWRMRPGVRRRSKA
jgi:autotransporter-associated beta strand protein